MIGFENTAVLGAGVIGASWAALFLASGNNVAVFDPSEGTEKSVRDYLAMAWPTLNELGSIKDGPRGRLSFHRNAAEAVKGADFIQESVPERIRIKHALYGEIEPALKADAVVASSASGLTLSEMQAGWRDPSRLILGHPFNPPHLIPLVEVMGNERTAAGAVERAERFYRAVGKVTIRVKREVPGHVANRLQAALWREAIHLVKTGIASVEDVDTAVWAGPGLRWAAMGPTMLFHLGAGSGGLASFCERYTDSFNRWWDDLGSLHLDEAVAAQLSAGVAEEAGSETPAELSAKRDALITAMLKATARIRRSQAE
jgi:3-hydroxybutyryl-CoA dehydrogenase